MTEKSQRIQFWWDSESQSYQKFVVWNNASSRVALTRRYNMDAAVGWGRPRGWIAIQIDVRDSCRLGKRRNLNAGITLGMTTRERRYSSIL